MHASSPAAPAPSAPRPVPPLIAHRGNALDFPENTLPAFESALQLGARHVELDVQLSRDRVPFVLHDATLDRTCDARGAVWERPAAELRGIDAAETARLGPAHAGTRLPELASALSLLQRWDAATLFVEIKTESIVQFGLRTVLDAVLEPLAAQPGHWVIISFDYEAVAQARTLSGLPIGWVLSRYDAASLDRVRSLAPEYVFCNWQKLPTRSALWPGRWRWCSYEVREVGRARSLLARGVDLVETMAVRKMCEALVGGTHRPT